MPDVRPSFAGGWPGRRSAVVAAGAGLVLLALTGLLRGPGPARVDDSSSGNGPPAVDGYFATKGAGSLRDLPGDAECGSRVHRSTWEPRSDNFVPNHTVPSVHPVRVALARRPRAVVGAYDRRWDAKILGRVTGGQVGTTDEIIQWAACKWGVSDNLLRAMAVRESNWFQYEVYRGGRCVLQSGCGDVIASPTPATRAFCEMEAHWGIDYQGQFGPGRCPKTFSIIGVASWHDPRWSVLPGNQNGTFPFNRDSTAFALDYAASFLRGCMEGWVVWLQHSGPYRRGDIWGCVGAWYAGAWRTAPARDYIRNVRTTLRRHVWLSPEWADHELPCHPRLGCPQGLPRRFVTRATTWVP